MKTNKLNWTFANIKAKQVNNRIQSTLLNSHNHQFNKLEYYFSLAFF